jgi:hypothetical protein
MKEKLGREIAHLFFPIEKYLGSKRAQERKYVIFPKRENFSAKCYVVLKRVVCSNENSMSFIYSMP